MNKPIQETYMNILSKVIQFCHQHSQTINFIFVCHLSLNKLFTMKKRVIICEERSVFHPPKEWIENELCVLSRMERGMVVLSWILLISTFPISLLFCLKIVNEYKRLVVFRLGKIWNSLPSGPGIVILLPFVDEPRIVDLRTMSYDVPAQELLTRDSVTISVEAVVYHKISDPVASISGVSDCQHATRQLAQTVLRNVLSLRTLEQIMMDREGIAMEAKTLLHSATRSWGIDVERVEVKDIRLPSQLCRSMAAEAEAVRQYQAHYASSNGEINASIALREAADEMKGCPMALHLRYLHSLVKISSHDNHTIVVPIPVEVISHIIQKNNK